MLLVLNDLNRSYLGAFQVERVYIPAKNWSQKPENLWLEAVFRTAS